WKDGDLLQSQGNPFSSGLPGVARAENLHFDTALLRMALFSAGSSVAVPQLLLPDAFRSVHFFSLIADARIAGEEQIDGHQAFRIEGTLASMPIKLWIDKSQYLVLKSYRTVPINKQDETTVQYKPKLNAPVPPEDLTLPQSLNQTIAGTTNSQSVGRLAPITPQILARPPRLRNFGSSLSRAEAAGAITE